MIGLAWGKLLINLNNAVNALSGKTLRDELGHRDFRRVFAASMREGLDLLKRAEIEPAAVGQISPAILPRIIDAPDWLFNSLFMRRWKIDAKARSSMADDLAAGRKTEIDYLNGELVRLADRLQRSAPVNRAIVELVPQGRSLRSGTDPPRGAEEGCAGQLAVARSRARVRRRLARAPLGRPGPWSTNRSPGDRQSEDDDADPNDGGIRFDQRKYVGAVR